MNIYIESRKHDCSADHYCWCDHCNSIADARKRLAEYGVTEADTAEVGDEFTVDDDYDYRVIAEND